MQTKSQMINIETVITTHARPNTIKTISLSHKLEIEAKRLKLMFAIVCT